MQKQTQKRLKSGFKIISWTVSTLEEGVEVLCFLSSTHYPLYGFDLRATHARTLLPEALASVVSFGFVLVRVRVRNVRDISIFYATNTMKIYAFLAIGRKPMPILVWAWYSSGNGKWPTFLKLPAGNSRERVFSVTKKSADFPGFCPLPTSG